MKNEKSPLDERYCCEGTRIYEIIQRNPDGSGIARFIGTHENAIEVTKKMNEFNETLNIFERAREEHENYGGDDD